MSTFFRYSIFMLFFFQAYTFHTQAQIIQVQRTSGVAPLGMHFSVVDTFSWNVLTSHDFEWTFPNGDIQLGYQTVYTLLQPGWIKLTITAPNQSILEDSIYITPQDADLVYPGNQTLCISSSGNFTGCPVGASQQTTADLNSISFENGKRYLLYDGETFTLNTAKTLQNGSFLGHYGSGTSKPVVLISGNENTTSFYVQDTVVITGIRFQGAEWVLGTNYLGEGRLFSPGNFNSLYDIEAQYMTTFVEQSNGTGLKRNLVLDKITARDLGANFLYGAPDPAISHGGIKNARIDNITAEHGLRFNGGEYFVIYDVAIDSVDRSQVTFRNIHHALVANSQFTGKALYKNSIRNVFDDFSLTDSVRFILYERNKYACNESELGLDFTIGQHIVVRNNLFLNAPVNVSTNLSNYQVQDVQIYHNTFHLDHYTFFSALNLRNGTTGSFLHNVAYITNCPDGPPAFCLEENPFTVSSSQVAADWNINYNCYFVDGNPDGSIRFKGSLSFSDWQALGFDNQSLYGNMGFQQISTDPSTADFMPLGGSLPESLVPHLTQRDITGALRPYNTPNDAGAYEKDPATPGLNLIKEHPVKVKVYPNPATEITMVEIPNYTPGTVLYITDITGKNVLYQLVDSAMQNISVSGWQPGIYFMTVVSGNARETLKLIIQ